MVSQENPFAVQRRPQDRLDYLAAVGEPSALTNPPTRQRRYYRLQNAVQALDVLVLKRPGVDEESDWKNVRGRIEWKNFGQFVYS